MSDIGVIVRGNAGQLKTELVSASAAVKDFGDQSSKYLQKGELSAKQMAFATRGLPAQFTDIAVSLQAGQNPMTVFLQQGGQLKDMFGGIGPATKAMGGYLLGLINPYTVAATAAAVLGYAWYKGAAEAGEYNKALVLSGNTAGATASQMHDMARAIAAGSSASIGDAADAVTQLVSTGAVASSKIQEFAATAVSMQQLAGVAVSDTVKQFVELGKDPVAASLKLNETTGYLTTSVYEQIRALMDQGRTLEAGALAQQAYGDAMNSRMPQLEDNLLRIEQWWRSIAKASKDAWSNMISASDPATMLRARLGVLEGSSKYADGSYMGGAAVGNEIAALQEKIKYYDHIAASNKDLAAFQAAQNKQLEAAVGWDKLHDQYLSKALQKEKAITQATQLYRDKMQDPGAALPADVLSGIEKKFKESPGRVKATKADPWLSGVAKSYASAMDQLGQAQSAAAAKAEDLSRSQAKLRDIMGAPEWESYSRQQREQIIVAASLAQAEEDKAKAMEHATEAAKQEARVAHFFAKADLAASGRNLQAVEGIARDQQTPQERESEIYAARLAQLAVFNASRLEGEAGVNALIETENARHIQVLADMQSSRDMQSLAMAGNTADQFYNLLQKSGQEQSALGKAVFLASKAIAVAEILLNTEVAAAKAGAQLGIFGIPMAMMIRVTGYASAGMVAGMAIAEASAREGYDIPEGINPVVQTHAKEMILPRPEANVIRALARDGGTAKPGAITIINQTRNPIGRATEQTQPNGDRAIVIEEASNVAAARIVAQLADPNSNMSRGLGRSFALQRSR